MINLAQVGQRKHDPFNLFLSWYQIPEGPCKGLPLSWDFRRAEQSEWKGQMQSQVRAQGSRQWRCRKVGDRPNPGNVAARK